MIRTGHVGKRELFALLTVFAGTDVFLSYPQQMVARGAQAAWMIPLISMLFALFFFALMGRIVRKYGQGSFYPQRGGRGIGVGLIAGSLFVSYFVLVTASEMRQFTETVVTTVLPKTPVGFVALPFLLVITYFAYMGIEGLTRVAFVTGPWLLLGLVLLLLTNLNWAHPAYLLPFWGNGLEETLVQGVHFSSMYSNILILSLLAPLLREKEDVFKVGTQSIVTVTCIYALVALVFVMVFTAEAAGKMPFPLYQFARLIYLGRFFQRLESAFVFIWVACAVIKMATGLWICSYLTANIWKMPAYRPLVLAFALIIFALSFLPKNFPETLRYDVTYLLDWGWIFVLVLPTWIVLLANRSKRKEEAHETETGRAS
jgi:spore germination protein KB